MFRAWGFDFFDIPNLHFYLLDSCVVLCETFVVVVSEAVVVIVVELQVAPITTTTTNTSELSHGVTVENTYFSSPHIADITIFWDQTQHSKFSIHHFTDFCEEPKKASLSRGFSAKVLQVMLFYGFSCRPGKRPGQSLIRPWLSAQLRCSRCSRGNEECHE